MSNRAMARMYGGGGGGYNDGPSIYDFISALTGQDKVEGGPTYDEATKTWKPGQYKASEGFFGRKARNQAIGLNQQMNVPAYLEQQRHGGAMELENQQSQNAKALQTLIQNGAINLEKLKHSNAIEDTTLKQHAEVLGKEGIPYSEANRKVYDTTLTDRKIRNAANKEDLENAYYNDPNTPSLFTKGQQARDMSQFFANQANSRVMAGPNTVVSFSDQVGGGNNQLLRGPLENRLATTIGGMPYTDPNTGQQSIVGGRPILNETYTQGGLDNPLGRFNPRIAPPGLINQASKLTQPAPAPKVAPPQMRSPFNQGASNPMPITQPPQPQGSANFWQPQATDYLPPDRGGVGAGDIFKSLPGSFLDQLKILSRMLQGGPQNENVTLWDDTPYQ